MRFTGRSGRSYALTPRSVRGGHANVYLAHSDDHRSYAIKVAKLETENARLLAEIELHRWLETHRVDLRRQTVPVVDDGDFEGRAFLVMPWREDRLDHWLPNRTLQSRLRLAVELTVVVERLGRSPLPMVHRDIKPANLFVIEDDSRIELADFGFASPQDRAFVAVNGAYTLGFAPLDQILPRRLTALDASWDRYALAATVFFVVAEQSPFGAGAAAEAMTALGRELLELQGVVASGQGSEAQHRRFAELMNAPLPELAYLDRIVQISNTDVHLLTAALTERLRQAGHPDASRQAQWWSELLVPVLQTYLEPEPSARPRDVGALRDALQEMLADLDDPGRRDEVAPPPPLPPALAEPAVVIVASRADRLPVRDGLLRLRAQGLDIPEAWFQVARGGGPGDEPSDDTLVERMARASEIWVFWSGAASRDPRVRGLVRSVVEVCRDRGFDPHENELVLTHRLDRTPLPAELDGSPGAIPPSISLMALGIVGVGAVGLATDRVGVIEAGFALVGLLVTLGVGLSYVIRRPLPLWGAVVLMKFGRWLDRASVIDLLAAAEELLDRVFGKRLCSRRSLLVSALISALSLVPIAWSWGRYFGVLLDPSGTGRLPYVLAGALLSTAVSLPLALGNLLFDYVSILTTRFVIRRILQRPRRGVVVLGLLLDGAVVVLCAVGTVYSNVAGLMAFGVTSQSWSAWPRFVLSAPVWVATGQVNLVNALTSPQLGGILVSFVAMVTAALPSLVHGSLLVAALANWTMFQAPFRWLGDGLRRWARATHGPWLVVVLGLVGLSVAPAGASILRPVEVPALPEVWSADRFVVVRSTECERFCTIGCGEAAWPCRPWERTRTVSSLDPFALTRTEVPQGLWESVWWHAAARVPDRLGLPRNPSVFAGPEHPVDNVSWCQAARFANLWSLYEGRRPHYRGPGPRGTVALEACERSGARRTEDGDGYRLPTDAEWEVAARGDSRGHFWTGDDVTELIRVDWVAANSGMRTHPVGRPPDPRAPRHPFGLTDLHGNVREWVEDPIDTGVSNGVQMRALRGGAFVHQSMLVHDVRRGDVRSVPWWEAARLVHRDGNYPKAHYFGVGFRLVRDPGR